MSNGFNKVLILGGIGGLAYLIWLMRNKPQIVAIPLSNLSILPAEPYEGEQMTVSCTATNITSATASLDVAFNIDGIDVETKPVTLNAGEYTEVAFTTIASGVGSHTVSLIGAQ